MLLACSGNYNTSDYSSAMSENEAGKPLYSQLKFPYDLNNPDEKYMLPGNLIEVSGIAFYNENKILCIQDEKANIYVLNLPEKEIIQKYKFGKDGDFEDIAVIGKTVYVLRSDGHIFIINNFDNENIQVTDYDTPLSGKNNTEGITYDKKSNSLLIACKGSPEINDKKYKGSKSVYHFNLESMKLDKEPSVLVDLKKLDGFKPSGIAVCPVTEEIYLISGSSKDLIVMDREGKLLYTHHLNPSLFRQPEGICFSPSGDLYISNEGSGGSGSIYKFIRH